MARIKFLQFMLLMLILASSALALNSSEENVTAYVFVGATCPHCAELEEFLDGISMDYPYLEIKIYEVWHNEDNRAILDDMAQQYGISVRGVPTYFIGDYHFTGYSPKMNDEIINAIENPYSDNESGNPDTSAGESIDIPIVGEVDAERVSLPAITVILGFLDGFNPCAFFVLLFLLSMLVYAKSRKRMLIIGLTFVFFSGLIYFLFMSAWLNFFMITKNITFITTIAGIIALIIAAINIKDFFAFKKGVSLSISDKHRATLLSKMRGLLKAESLASMLIGTIVLAITANLYELLCTAGFPMVFAKILVINELDSAAYYSYLLLYNIVYVIPLLAIVLFFTYTFGAKKLSQSQGEALKLLSGMMMLSLGLILVISPGLLNNFVAAIGIIFTAVLITLIILIVRRFAKNKTDGNHDDSEVKKR